MIATILVVDDERAIRELCAAILSGCGYSCETAGSGAEGIDRFTNAKGGFDLILSDLVMPQVSGPEMVRQMRCIQPNLRSVYMSGFADAAIPLAARPVLLIKKPFTIERLVAVVKQTLAQ